MTGKFSLMASLSLLLMLIGPLAISSDKSRRPPLQLDDYFRMQTASSPSFSPDGKYIVYRLTLTDIMEDRRKPQLWLMRADGTGARKIAESWSAKWLDHNTIAYRVQGGEGSSYVTRKINSLDQKGIGEEIPLELEGERPGNPVWSPSGAKLAWVSSVPAETRNTAVDMPAKPVGAEWKEEPTIIDGLQYRVGLNRYRTTNKHVFAASIEKGVGEQITQGQWNVGAFYAGIPFGSTISWLPGEKALLVPGNPNNTDTIQGWMTSHILKVDLMDKSVQQISSLDGFWRRPVVSPKGLVAYTGYQATRDIFPVRQIRVMNIDGSSDRLLYNDFPDRVGTMIWNDSGDELYMSMNHQGATKLVAVTLSGELRIIAEGPWRFYLRDMVGDLALGVFESPTQSREIAIVNTKTGQLKQLTVHNSLLSKRTLGDVEMFWTNSSDGTRVQGWLVKPVDFDPAKKYPLILDIHGGPDLMVGFEFDFRYHEFASRGYLVAYSNPRGSTGYGQEFANGIDGGFPGTRDREDLMSILNAVRDRGFVDGSNINVMGCSGGGTLAAWLTSFSNVFSASAVMCPVVNWVSMMGTSDATSWVYNVFKQPFWEDMDKWLEHSVISRVGHINTPTLIANGYLDVRTPTSQSAELYTALRVRGVPTRLMIYPNAGHGPWRYVPSDLVRSQLYLDEWFSTHVKN